MTAKKIKKKLKQLNKEGLKVLFFVDEKKSAIYFDVSENTGNGWLEFTSDMLTKTGCEMARCWIKKKGITNKVEQDFHCMFYSLDEKYHMEGIQ